MENVITGIKTKKQLKELLAEGQIFANCVWDCYSAYAAEKAGFKAILISSFAVCQSRYGLPDFKFITIDDMEEIVKNIARFTTLPIIVDAEDVYSHSPIVTYRNCRRLIEAGASALSVDDGDPMTGWERIMYYREKQRITGGKLYDHVASWNVIPREMYYSKIKSAVMACEGTDAMIIARSEAKMNNGLEEAIERNVHASELGAQMTLCLGLDDLNEAKKMAQELPGWKMYGDIMARDGESDVDLEAIYKLGFNLVTHHSLEKGAMYGMMLFATENVKNNNAVFSEMFDTSKYFKDMSEFTDFRAWLELEEKLRN